MAGDWYRSTDWNEEVERHFFEKLRRSRDKAQYLRIQAYTLARIHPVVTLQLLEEYFKLGEERFDLALSYVDQATAYVTLDKIDFAIRSYKKALDREVEFPNSTTRAYLELPSLIASKKLDEHYHEALIILEKHSSYNNFPVDHFQWHASFAIISKELGQYDVAKVHAKQAISAARNTHSGFRNHPNLGLVGDEQTGDRQKMENILLDVSIEI